MGHVIFLSRFEPSPVGSGGNHRSYQIQWDCLDALGASKVTCLSVPFWLERARDSRGRWSALIWRWSSRLRQVSRNPARALVRHGFSARRYAIPGLFQEYERLVRGIEPPIVCIIEDAGLSDVIPINTRLGIPTVACTQNIESFDVAPLSVSAKLYNLARVTAFVDEFAVLAQCAERLFLSKVEVGVIGGLGLTARHYPYRPVGEVARNLQAIRDRRKRSEPLPAFFLLLGTVTRRATRASFEWFIGNALHHGLPEGARVVVAGKGSDALGKQFPSHEEAFEFRGWLNDVELDNLLCQACAVLVPQYYGFGALTRLPELTLAGIPLIVSAHATMAFDPMPGVIQVQHDWAAWYEAMDYVAKVGLDEGSAGSRQVSPTSQENTLAGTLRKLFGS
jgi:hypothetical protein